MERPCHYNVQCGVTSTQDEIGTALRLPSIKQCLCVCRKRPQSWGRWDLVRDLDCRHHPRIAAIRTVTQIIIYKNVTTRRTMDENVIINTTCKSEKGKKEKVKTTTTIRYAEQKQKQNEKKENKETKTKAKTKKETHRVDVLEPEHIARAHM